MGGEKKGKEEAAGGVAVEGTGRGVLEWEETGVQGDEERAGGERKGKGKQRVELLWEA